MEKPKIIHIIGRSPAPAAYIDISDPNAPLPKHYITIPTPPGWLGFFEGDFYVRIAGEVRKATDRYENECWQPYIGADKIYTKEINGVTHRIFPSYPPKMMNLGQKITIRGEYSKHMVKELEKEISKGNVLIHLHGFPGGHNDTILKKADLHNIPVVVQHRGGSFRFDQYHFKEKNLTNRLLAIIFRLHTFWLQKRHLRKVDCFLMGSKFVGDIIEAMGLGKVVLHKDGVDFDIFKKGDKREARDELDLSQETKIMLFVGRFAGSKGVERLLDVYTNLKSKENVQLILIGGESSQELYAEAEKAGAMVFEKMERKELVKYYQASDVFITLPPPPTQRFGGFGTVRVESLGCGVPQVSSNLAHFAGTEEEMEQLGETPTSNDDLEDVERCILTVFDNPDKYSNCREIAKKYYDISVTIQNNLDVYGELFKKYYGE